MILFTKLNRLTDFENRLNFTHGDRPWGGIHQESGMNTYTRLYIKEIINQGLLDSAGNFTQNSVVAYMGEESEKKYVFV